MKPQSAHAHEDRLLEFAYGELSPTEARGVEQHVQECSRCAEALDDIRGVRTVMARLPVEPAPDAGLESLMAYAQQAARRAAAGPAPESRWWRRWLVPAVGLATVSVFGIVVLQVNREVDLRPNLQAEAVPKGEAAQAASAPTQGAPGPAEPAAEGAPASAAAPMPTSREEKPAEAEESFGKVSKRSAPMRKTKASFEASNAGSGGGFPDKKVAPRDEEADRAELEALYGQKLAAESEARKERAPEPLPVSNETKEAMRLPGTQAPQEEEPSSSLRLGGSSRAAAGERAPASARPSAPAFEPSRGRSADEPPPPAAPPPSSAVEAVSEAAEPPERTDARAAPEDRRASSASPEVLSQRAQEAYRAKDRAREVVLLRAALEAGAAGGQRVELLGRLCDAEFALGRREAAIEVCKQVLVEGPRSQAAQLARSRLKQVSAPAAQEPAAPAAPAD